MSIIKTIYNKLYGPSIDIIEEMCDTDKILVRIKFLKDYKNACLEVRCYDKDGDYIESHSACGCARINETIKLTVNIPEHVKSYKYKLYAYDDDQW